MVDEWEAQNIFTRYITSDILGLLTMDSDHCYFNPQNMCLKHTFLHGFGFITHQTLTEDEWEAQNILTSSIS
jgi:hypothetical protein